MLRYDDNTKKIMDATEIHTLSVAFGSIDENGNKKVTTKKENILDDDESFGAASLSKSVFSYLILKLAQANVLKLDEKINDALSFEKFWDEFCRDEEQKVKAQGQKYHKRKWEKKEKDQEWLASMTPEMALAHTTGFDLANQPGGTLEILYQPGTKFWYSGLPYIYLQRMIEARTGKSLEQLAQEYVFGPLNLKMSFGPDPNAANSLKTTASAYANLMLAWINDKDETIQKAFTKHISMTEDEMATSLGIPKSKLENEASGLGWELELDDRGKAVRAYKTGDMGPWRAQVAIDLKNKTVIVYLSKGPEDKLPNGHILADEIINKNIQFQHLIQNFSEKWGFAVKFEHGWEENEKARFEKIGAYLNLPNWQKLLINTLYETIKNNYIFSEKIDEATFKTMLIKSFSEINAKSLKLDKKEFCSQVNEILKTIDPHLILQYDPAQISDRASNNRIIPDARKNNCAKFNLTGLDAPKEMYESFQKQNYGFVEQPERKIPIDMGYVKINDFLDPERDNLGKLAKEKAEAILKSMQDKNAIIIDLRDSHGGSPKMVELILNYLLTNADKEKIKQGVYNTIYDRSTEQTQEYKVNPTSFSLNVPIYILTNAKTFSVAEELPYDVIQLNTHVLKDNRFTVIGETTRGGAHPMTGFPLMDANHDVNHDYFIWVPTQAAKNPYSHTNWEDGPKAEGMTPGVQPDIAIDKQQDALEVAVNHYQNAVTKQVDNKSGSTKLVTTTLLASRPQEDIQKVLQSYKVQKPDEPVKEEKKVQVQNVVGASKEKEITNDADLNTKTFNK